MDSAQTRPAALLLAKGPRTRSLASGSVRSVLCSIPIRCAEGEGLPPSFCRAACFGTAKSFSLCHALRDCGFRYSDLAAAVSSTALRPSRDRLLMSYEDDETSLRRCWPQQPARFLCLANCNPPERTVRCFPCTRFLHDKVTAVQKGWRKGEDTGFWVSGSLSLYLDVSTMEHTKVDGIT